MQRIFIRRKEYRTFTVRNAAERRLQEKLHHVFHQYGFEDIDSHL